MALLLMLFSIVVLLIAYLIVSTILKLRSSKAKFNKQGIPYFGVKLKEFISLFGGSTSLVEFEEKVYQEAVTCNSPLVVHFDFGGDLMLVTDLELIKSILVKDFDHFINTRTVETQQTNKYFKKMLFALQNEQWKGVRTKLSPSFTTGRIRKMFQIFHQSGEKMSSYLKNVIGHSTRRTMEMNMSPICSKFTMDVIASCIFGGMDSKSWEFKPDEKSDFEKMGQKITFQLDFKSVVKFTILTAAPKLADMLGLDVMDSEAEAYFAEVVKDVMKRRRTTGEKRDDFLQLMLEAQQGLLKADEEGTQSKDGEEDPQNSKITVSDAVKNAVTLDDDDVIANALLFLLAGYDNILSILVFVLYSLAVETEVQEKLHDEIIRVLEGHKGEMTYGAISEMTYLECVIHESMRLYPPATRTERTCTRDYPVPGTNAVIEKGTMVGIPVLGLQRDPRYFPEPHKFIPERFTQENKAKRHAYTYLPFGIGPRSCIAMRFAILQVKTVLAQLVLDFKYEPCAKTLIPMEFGKDATIKPKGGMWLNVTCRE